MGDDLGGVLRISTGRLTQAPACDFGRSTSEYFCSHQIRHKRALCLSAVNNALSRSANEIHHRYLYLPAGRNSQGFT